MRRSLTIAATGDSFITRRLPENDHNSSVIYDIMKQADVRFTNLEVTTHHFEGFPSAISGGSWSIAEPEVLEDLKKYGVNLIGWATNHALDFSYGGLRATERNLNKYNFIHAGAGRNLAEANEPRYLETVNGRVALISTTSTFHETWRAGEQRPDIIGRPGVNPLGHNIVYKVSRESMAALKSIANNVSINAENDLHVQLGIKNKTKEDEFLFGEHKFKVGEEEEQVTTPDKEDMKRILKAVSEAKRQADFVIVSVHSHEMAEGDLEKPPNFLKEFSRECIDRGANAIIGHGPHILRGIEIYKKSPIFYSLGNFIFQNDTMTKQPMEFYDKHNLDHNSNVAELFDSRTDKDTKGFVVDEKVWSSIIPVWKMKDNRIFELTLYPIELGINQARSQRGWPKLEKRNDILERLQTLSEPFGTNIKLSNGLGKVEL